ncbi:unnamed protein product [Blumeria hordei]|uniref:Uncharacterized protein n=1 Tax=Blumeria hordei TaxID=2867405 RepID=A0A383UQS9_BLUHO|nr:unnamed protein product [Blumeria hordei]
MFDHRALLILIFSFTFALASPVPAWGEYKLNTQYPPWPSRPCADFGASACFHAEGREDLLVSRGMMVCDPGTEMWLPCPSCASNGETSGC